MRTIQPGLLIDPGTEKLFPIYYKKEVSAAFINCADKQLSAQFEKETGLAIVYGIRMMWDRDLDLRYEKGTRSGINANIWMRYGGITVRITWSALSGRIYELSDRGIDCNDIVFELEGIDKERCQKLTNPKWTLVTFPEMQLASIAFKKGTPVPVSLEFITCYDKQLTPIFESLAGFKVNGLIALWINLNDGDFQEFYYVKDSVSRLGMDLNINACKNNLIICWKSKSGRIYDIGDTGIDCADIEFWFEGFDALLYHKQMFPKLELPFKLKNLSYELVMTRLNMDMTIDMQLKETAVPEANTIIATIDAFIDDYNTSSEKKYMKHGVVHNWKRRTAGNKLVYDIDTGFTGAYFLKKILQFLSTMNVFETVEVM